MSEKLGMGEITEKLSDFVGRAQFSRYQYQETHVCGD